MNSNGETPSETYKGSVKNEASTVQNNGAPEPVKAKNPHSEFKVGDYLVYPIHGIGRVNAIAKHKVLGKVQSYYELEIEYNNMKVMIPVKTAEEIGVRTIINKEEVEKVIEELKKPDIDTEEDWKLRYQNNIGKVKTGDIYAIAEVCRNLFKRACDKDLSLMERRLYETAYRLIATELAIAQDLSVEEAGNMLSEILA